MLTSVSVTNLSDGCSAFLTILPRTVERCAAPNGPKMTRVYAMNQLGNGLAMVERHEERLGVLKAKLATDTRIGAGPDIILGTQSNIAMSYSVLGRKQESLGVYREIYAKAVELHGKSDERTFAATNNLSSCLKEAGHIAEAIALLRQGIPEAKKSLGAEHDITLSLCQALAQCLCDEHGASPEQIREAVALLESTLRTSQRVFGRAHPNTKRLEGDLAIARLMLPRP